MHLDLNEDQNPEPFSPNHYASSSFSSLSSYNPILFHPSDQDHQQGSYYSCEPKHLPNVEEVVTHIYILIIISIYVSGTIN